MQQNIYMFNKNFDMHTFGPRDTLPEFTGNFLDFHKQISMSLFKTLLDWKLEFFETIDLF